VQRPSRGAAKRIELKRGHSFPLATERKKKQSWSFYKIMAASRCYIYEDSLLPQLMQRRKVNKSPQNPNVKYRNLPRKKKVRK
jgi:hypothetical protein